MAQKLLLADDSVTIQRVIELTFADEDIEVVAVGDGQQAIDRIGADPPDVVLADVGMPERDGYEVASFVKQTPRLAHIPVLLLTGAFEPVDEARARAAGCDGVLVKPFEPQMVINRVKDLLAGRRSDSMWATPPAQPAGAAPSPAPPPAAATEARPAADAAPGSDSLDEYFDRLDAAFAGLGADPATAAEPAGETRPDGQEAPAEPLPASAFDTLEPEPPAGAAASTAADGLGGWDPGLGDDEPAPARAAAPPPPAPLAPAASSPPPADGPLGESRRAASSLRPAEPPMPAFTPKPPAAPQAPESAPATMPSLSDAFGALLAAEQERPQPAAPARAAVTDETIELVVQKVVERLTTAAVRETVTDVAERLVREEIARIKNQAR